MQSGMWRESILRMSPECGFRLPAAPTQLAQIEAVLRVTLPGDLAGLLLESNGVFDKYGSGLVWPAEQITEINQMFRHNPDYADLYMPFDALLFFADESNGDQFAFSIVAGAIRREDIYIEDIYIWNHENDSRTWVAPSLQSYLDWRLSGTLPL